MKPMSKQYSATIAHLEEMLDEEHCSGCDQLTCDIDVCFDDGYTLWAIQLFAWCGAASDKYMRLFKSLPKRFKTDAERERKEFVDTTSCAQCDHCNAITWHTEHFDDTIHCESCDRPFKKPRGPYEKRKPKVSDRVNSDDHRSRSES